MVTKRASKRIAGRERARKRRRRQQTKQFAIVGAGLLLIAASIYMSLGKSPTIVDIDYKPEDVVYDQPILAIHEMTGPSLSTIPFLPKDSPQPQITVSETFYDFGSIGPQDLVEHEFLIANYGEATLTISRAYTTCGCTTAEFTSTVIPPGKVVIMTLTLDAGFHDVSGQTVRRGVIIENNDPQNSQLEIWTQASVQNN